MPNGQTHDMLTIVTGVVGVPIMWALLPSHDLLGAMAWAGSHIISGMAFSPDLDLASEPYRRWGPLRYIWLPYREFIPHRAGLSHGLVFAPLFRLAYFLFMAWISFQLGTFLISNLTPVDGWAISREFGMALRDLWYTQRSMVVYALLGFVTGSAVHTFADWFTEGGEPFHASLYKLGRRKRRKKDEWGIW